jgi:hypothetical protein
MDSEAGTSAQREYQRRSDNHREEVRRRHPHIGGLLLRVQGEPQAVTAWAKGAKGERILGRGLDGLASESVRVLHDRRMPRSTANIDHIVVAPSGIYVVDAKNYRGKVEQRDKGTLSRRDLRLYVGGRDKSKLLDAMTKQVATVRTHVHPDVPIHPVLCFVHVDWALFANPFTLREVTVCWPRALYKRVLAQGVGTVEQVHRSYDSLARALPPA